jgi:hypothetical protein
MPKERVSWRAIELIGRLLSPNRLSIPTFLSGQSVVRRLWDFATVSSTYFFVQGWLEHFAFRIERGVVIFVGPALMVSWFR